MIDPTPLLLPRALRRPAVPLALLTIAIHLYAGRNYGYFRDELYFIVCGQRLDWGFVDQPPLIPMIAAAMHALFPGSLVMLRMLPALAHAATVALTAETARRLDGGIWAQALAALSVLVCGVYLAFGTILVTDVLEPLTWLFCAYALIRLVRDHNERWWLAVGATAGVAFLAKYTIAFWLVALGVGLLATPARRTLARRECWFAAAIFMLIVLPNVLWQARHGWPFLEIGRVAVTSKNVALTPWAFVLAEIRTLNPGTVAVWLTGLAALLVWRRFADLRFLAIAFVVLIAAMIALHGKDYYPVGAYPVLFAAGAAALEAWIIRPILRAALIAELLTLGLVGAPFALPVLPIERFLDYQDRLGLAPEQLEHSPLGRLPEYYADMFGWPDLAAMVGRAYQALPPQDRARAVFLADNYGEAAAVDVFGGPWRLPPAISAHNNYFLWGPRGHDGSVIIRLGGNREALLKLYASVEAAGVFDNPWAMPYETGRTIWICRNREPPLDEAWSSLRNYR
jgi:hypothetical protein